jgi:hypothetical protein
MLLFSWVILCGKLVRLSMRHGGGGGTYVLRQIVEFSLNTYQSFGSSQGKKFTGLFRTRKYTPASTHTTADMRLVC